MLQKMRVGGGIVRTCVGGVWWLRREGQDLAGGGELGFGGGRGG